MTDTHTAPQPGTTTGWGFRLLVVAICSATLVLTSWAGAQARTVEQQLDRASRQIPHTPVRQIERDQQADTDKFTSAATHDRHRFANQASLPGRSTPRGLMVLEYSELRRFRNRAPASALPALDAEIERLRTALSP